jgi:P4 family phage/plasmid primase-like protien
MTQTLTNTFRCNVDNVFYKNKADAKTAVGGIVNRMKATDHIKEITAEKLSQLVTQGYSFTTAELNGRAEENFISQWLAVVDIDNDRKDIPTLSVADALSILETHSINYSFIYYSYSHSTQLNKFRIVCILSEPMTNPKEAKRLNQYLISLFPQADQACINLDRFYYGTDKGLATEVFERTAEIIIPDDWQPEPEHLTSPPIGATVKEFKPKTAANDFNLTLEIKQFDLLSYVEHVTGTQGKKRGKDYLFNPCPVCGHQDDFYIDVEKNVYKCHSAANGSAGNIINYLMNTHSLDRKAAREYFIYDIMKQDRQAQKEAFKKAKNTRQERTGENKADNAPGRTQGKAYKYDFIKINPFETLEARRRYGWNDIGMGYLFADAYKNISRFVLEAKSWYVYDGRVWKADLNGAIVAQQARDLMDYLLDCRNLLDDEAREKWVDFISKRLKKSARDTMIADALSEYPVSIQDFDKDPYMFNCQNCTLNLKDFTQHAHRPSDFLSKISNVIFDPKAKCDRWTTFINEIMQDDIDKAKFLQKGLGYTLTGDTSKECFFILYGSTSRNGKGTTMETTLHIIGDYGRTTEPETITQKQNQSGGNPSEDIAGLKGARFVNISEPDKGIRLNNALVKRVTGGDSIRARFLHQNSFEFRPEFKLFINTNHLPRITDDTVFKSGRVKLIPFERHFPESEQDDNLKPFFKQPENMSGIFNWFIEGLKLLNNEGLKQPESVRAATAQYQEDSDTIGVFIRECLIEAKNSNVTLKEVYKEYEQWCENNGFNPLNNRNLSTEFRRKGLKVESGAHNKMCLYGYNLISDIPKEWREPQDLPV